MKAREYAGPLGVLAAGAIGFSLLCSVSAMAMSDLNQRVSITMEPLNIVGLAVSNFETAAALTEQVVTAFVPTQTLVPTNTLVPTSAPSDTATATPRRFVTITPTLTRRARPPITKTNIPPTNTPVPPTRTSVPPPTNTNTPVPPTDTPIPPPTETDTPVPPTEAPASNTPDPGTPPTDLPVFFSTP